jgi:hypothetical protein
MEDQPRRRPADEEDEDYPRSRARRAPGPGPAGKNVSVIGVISLVIGVLGLVLSLVPCLNLFTWPLQLVGVILAFVGVLISAIGQRDGLGLPVTGLTVNLLACVVPVAMYLGFCGLGKWSAQQAVQAAQAEQARQEAERQREEAEALQEADANVAALVGQFTEPQGQGPLTGLGALRLVSLPHGQAPDALVIDADTLLWEYAQNPRQADRKYRGKTLVVEGTVDWGDDPLDPGHSLFVLKGDRPNGGDVQCKFDKPGVPEPDMIWLKDRQVTVQGRCQGTAAKVVGGRVVLDSCRLLK